MALARAVAISRRPAARRNAASPKRGTALARRSSAAVVVRAARGSAAAAEDAIWLGVVVAGFPLFFAAGVAGFYAVELLGIEPDTSVAGEDPLTFIVVTATTFAIWMLGSVLISGVLAPKTD